MFPEHGPSLLIIEDDPDLRDSLRLLLAEVGYRVDFATAIDAALNQIATHAYHLILSDLFSVTGRDALASIAPLMQAAYPTPLAVMTAHQLPIEVDRSPYAFVISKPFDVDHLLACIAAALSQPLEPASDAQAAIIMRYFAALNAHEYDQAVALCADDLRYYPPPNTRHAAPMLDLTAFRDFLRAMLEGYTRRSFEQILIYPTPNGRAARYLAQWEDASGATKQASGVGVYRFSGDRIAEIGIRTPSVFVQDDLPAGG